MFLNESWVFCYGNIFQEITQVELGGDLNGKRHKVCSKQLTLFNNDYIHLVSNFNKNVLLSSYRDACIQWRTIP